jgi:hypothetical protein
MSIRAAFDHACDDREVIAATELLSLWELVRLREPPRPLMHDAVIEPLMAAHARLWRIRTESEQLQNRQLSEDEPIAMLGTSQG